jgi:hypothetical protein
MHFLGDFDLQAAIFLVEIKKVMPVLDAELTNPSPHLSGRSFAGMGRYCKDLWGGVGREQ